MRISMSADIKKATAKLRGAQRKQIPAGIRRGINDTAFDVMKEETRQLDIKLDRPNPFTKRAFGVKKVTKGIAVKQMVATVFIKPVQSEYLRYQVEGGIRRPVKKALAIPFNQKLNQYGNIPKGKITALLARPDTFSGTVKGIGGIWQRNKKGGVKLLIAWETKANYRPRFPFYKIAKGKAGAVIGKNLRRGIEYMLRTAK